MVKKQVEQHIAVFGESGSGKTVLVSSFYGGTQQAQFKQTHPYAVTGDSQSQSRQLLANYLGMKSKASVPSATRFRSYEYAFTVTPGNQSVDKKDRPFEAIRVVWHDYPGEWLTEDVDGSEADDRLATFRRLMNSDVALILVDGERLEENSGEEERYLKSVLANVNDGLRRMQPAVVSDGQVATFPRIWMFALSKSDVLPLVDASSFRDMMIEKASYEIGELEETLRSYVTAPELLSIGEEYVLLSAAKFEPGKIDLSERVGVDLMLPLAAVLPLERFIRWAERLEGGQQFLAQVGANGDTLVGTLMKWLPLANAALAKKGGKVGAIVAAALTVSAPVIERLAAHSAERLTKAYMKTVARKDALGATLAEFRNQLAQAEERRELLRSDR